MQRCRESQGFRNGGYAKFRRLDDYALSSVLKKKIVETLIGPNQKFGKGYSKNKSWY